MKIYHYHPELKYFLGEDLADPSPLDPPGVWLIPANSTTTPPPKFENGKIPIFKDESWDIITDFRGKYYNIITGIEIYNDNPLIEPENCTTKVPPKVAENQILVWENNDWNLVNRNLMTNEITKLSPEDKLKALGLTIDDLKSLLGLSS